MNPRDHGGIIHATTDYARDIRTCGTCRICGRSLGHTSRYAYCNHCKEDGMAARAKVPGQIERLLARKAMWDAAREQAEREFSMSAIVGRAVRRTNATR